MDENLSEKNPACEPSRGSWGSGLGFVLAAAGSAVGLGNIWGFPMQVGKGGGAIFVPLYLACVAFICFPILVAELALGRAAEPAIAFARISAMMPPRARHRRSLDVATSAMTRKPIVPSGVVALTLAAVPCVTACASPSMA